MAKNGETARANAIGTSGEFGGTVTLESKAPTQRAVDRLLISSRSAASSPLLSSY